MTTSLDPVAPAWTQRLLAGLADQPSSLAEHVGRHGAPPAVIGVDGSARAYFLDEVERSGLLGRGGAGFPVGRKMRTVGAGSGPAVVVGNGCEGEPGSAKDTLLLARSPHLVLDGLQIAVRAVGADQAHLAMHRGSPAVWIVRRALEERARAGHDAVPVRLHELPARYVASEESALVHFINGGEAKPTFTPPRPFERGVANRPTLINNVETLAHLALITRHGADWYRQVGDPDEPGTQLLTVSGPGVSRRVLEVETGATVEEVLTGAGVDAQRAHAVLFGGYFGTWIPLSAGRHLSLTHRSLKAAGGALGAGIVIALPSGLCGLAETARVASYLSAHNAGQCGPCINGLPAIADAMHRLAFGPWNERLAPALDRWLTVVPGRGACRHPDGAVRLVATALQTFNDDVAAHRAGRPCAGRTAAPWLPLPGPGPARGPWR